MYFWGREPLRFSDAEGEFISKQQLARSRWHMGRVLTVPVITETFTPTLLKLKVAANSSAQSWCFPAESPKTTDVADQ